MIQLAQKIQLTQMIRWAHGEHTAHTVEEESDKRFTGCDTIWRQLFQIGLASKE
jgi:hypothetical protein